MQKKNWRGGGGVGGGVLAKRHDGVRNLLTSLTSKVCKNIEVEPHLQLLDKELLHFSMSE